MNTFCTKLQHKIRTLRRESPTFDLSDSSSHFAADCQNQGLVRSVSRNIYNYVQGRNSSSWSSSAENRRGIGGCDEWERQSKRVLVSILLTVRASQGTRPMFFALEFSKKKNSKVSARKQKAHHVFSWVRVCHESRSQKRWALSVLHNGRSFWWWHQAVTMLMSIMDCSKQEWKCIKVSKSNTWSCASYVSITRTLLNASAFANGFENYLAGIGRNVVDHRKQFWATKFQLIMWICQLMSFLLQVHNVCEK